MALPTIIAVGALVAGASAKVALLRNGDAIPNEYIVAFKKDVPVPEVKAFSEVIGAERVFTFGGLFKAAYGVFSPEAVEKLRARDDIIDFIEQNQGTPGQSCARACLVR